MVFFDILRVDLRNDKWDILGHSESGRVVDNNTAGFDSCWGIFFALCPSSTADEMITRSTADVIKRKIET